MLIRNTFMCCYLEYIDYFVRAGGPFCVSTLHPKISVPFWSFLGVRGPFCVPSQLVWSSPCPLTVRLVLPVSPHSLFGPLPLPVSPHSLFGPPRVPSQLVLSSPCHLTLLPVSPHSSFGPPRVPSIWLCPPSRVLKDFSVLFPMSFA